MDYDFMIGFRKNEIKRLKQKRWELFKESMRLEGEINLLIHQRDNEKNKVVSDD